MKILGIETSCDETAAAVVEDASRILSNVVASQFDTHARYGGVVPELASREHLRAIVPVAREAIEGAGGRFDAVAVTEGPGLVGSLLVGITYAKALCMAHGVPLAAVNHLEGHVHAVVMEAQLDGHPIEWPAVALIASGGHTHLFEAATAASSASGGAALAEDRGQRPTPVDRGAATAASSASTRLRYRLLGRTRDDAAGEAFDKVAKLLGFSYPGGPVLDALAPFGDPRGVKFTLAKMKGNPLDFSFSGLKTAVLRWTESHDTGAEIERRRELARATPHPTREDWRAATSQRTLDLIASFQHTVVGELLRRARAACEETGARALIVSGGVACNRGLRKSAASADIPCPVYFPTPALSTDNAVMIAAAAHPMLLSGQTSGWDLKARASLALA